MSRRLCVIGGGISGLSAALAGAELGFRVRVLEAGGEPGGVIRTLRRDGCLIEAGPDSFITEKPAALELCRRLGLEGEVIGTNPEARRSFIVHRGRLHPTPEGFYLLAPARLRTLAATPLLSWRGKLRAAADLVIRRGRPGGDESLAAFVRRRFGEEVLERLAQPLVAGIYTADPERLSLRATFPRFLEMEATHRSVILALRRRRAAAGAAASSGARYGLFATLKGGVAPLVEALVARLPADAVRCGTAATAVRRSGAGWRVETAQGGGEDADSVIVALPAPAAGRLLEAEDRELAAELGAVPYASTVTVHLAYRRRDIAHPLDGFGLVIPAVERRRLLACTFSHVKFAGRAPEGTALLRAFMGGGLQPEVAGFDEADLGRIAHENLRELLGIMAEPRFVEVRRHACAMPQYEVGHLDRLGRIALRLKGLPGLALAGNGYSGIGIPDCVASGKAAVEALAGD